MPRRAQRPLSLQAPSTLLHRPSRRSLADRSRLPQNVQPSAAPLHVARTASPWRLVLAARRGEPMAATWCCVNSTPTAMSFRDGSAQSAAMASSRTPSTGWSTVSRSRPPTSNETRTQILGDPAAAGADRRGAGGPSGFPRRCHGSRRSESSPLSADLANARAGAGKEKEADAILAAARAAHTIDGSYFSVILAS